MLDMEATKCNSGEFEFILAGEFGGHAVFNNVWFSRADGLGHRVAEAVVFIREPSTAIGGGVMDNTSPLSFLSP